MVLSPHNAVKFFDSVLSAVEALQGIYPYSETIAKGKIPVIDLNQKLPESVAERTEQTLNDN